MRKDIWGYQLSTESSDAAQSISTATSSFITWRTDTMAHLDAAISADPGIGLPHAIKGLLLFGMRNPDHYPAARAALAAAKNSQPARTDREKHYVAALEASLAGRITEAVTHYEAIAAESPLDLLALRLSQFELFWIGEVGWMRDISERAAAHWSEAIPSYSAFLALRSFGLEENGHYESAEAFGKESVARDPGDCWGAHAVAHVLIMQGRLDEGVQWIEGLTGNWESANHIVHHLWWHLALFYAESGDYPSALQIYDERLRNLESPLMKAIPDLYIDLQNDISILRRLELRGVDVGDRWQPLADLARPRIGNHASPFTSAHSVIALSRAGYDDDALETIQRIRDYVSSGEGTLTARYSAAGLPASEAAYAHCRGEFGRVIDLIMPARRNLWQMGGSHAQRDLFFQLAVDAAFKSERPDVLRLLFGDFQGFGLEHIAERSSYADAFASLH